MENLYERLDILEQAGLITPFVSEQAKKIVELITECGSPMDEEKMAMFTTHIAMAIQRILNGDVENPLEEAVLEELRKEEAYEKADEVAEKIYDIIEVEFPETRLVCMELRQRIWIKYGSHMSRYGRLVSMVYQHQWSMHRKSIM